jgi:hypothetical protein
MMSKINDKVLSELVSNQIKKMDSTKKLSYSDLLRVSKYLNKSIFNTNECIIWNGYITNHDKKDKGMYINFYFRQKKYALHRLLYINFKGPLFDDEYLKFTCSNKGICCNINHFHKINAENVSQQNLSAKTKKENKNDKTVDTDTDTENNSDNFILDFD